MHMIFYSMSIPVSTELTQFLYISRRNKLPRPLSPPLLALLDVVYCLYQICQLIILMCVCLLCTQTSI